MKTINSRWVARALGILMATVLYACLVPDGGYVGGAYVTSGYDYDGWGPGYRVAPPRHGERREDSRPSRAYRPVERSRPAPSIPNGPRRH